MVVGEGMTVDRQRSAPTQKGPGEALDLMLRAATLLFANGQTTERVMEATARLGGAFGFLADWFCQGSRPRHRNEQFRRYI